MKRPYLDKEELTRLYKKNDWRCATDVLSVFALIFGTILFYEKTASVFTYLISVLLIGALQHHLSIIQHEANHYLLFKSNRMNHWVGSLAAHLVGFTMGYREIHQKHHKNLGNDADPDLQNYEQYPASISIFLLDFVKNISGAAAIRQFLAQVIFTNLSKKTIRSSESKDKYGFLWLVITQLTLFFLFYYFFQWYDYFLIWIMPLITVSKSLAHFRNVVEHTLTRKLKDPELSRYRTIESSFFERFFFAPLYFNYHAEHHFYPGIPYYNLPTAHQLLSKQKEYLETVTVEKSYLHFLLFKAIRYSKH